MGVHAFPLSVHVRTLAPKASRGRPPFPPLNDNGKKRSGTDFQFVHFFMNFSSVLHLKFHVLSLNWGSGGSPRSSRNLNQKKSVHVIAKHRRGHIIKVHVAVRSTNVRSSRGVGQNVVGVQEFSMCGYVNFRSRKNGERAARKGLVGRYVNFRTG